MGKMQRFHAKRKRRTQKQKLRHGNNAKRSHTRKGGRTGSIMAKQGG